MFTDLNFPPAVRLREPASTPSLDTEDHRMPGTERPAIEIQPTSRSDEMKYGAANPRISTENPTHDNGITYGNLRRGLDEFTGSGNV
jgi:hypothetical protein